MELINDVKLHLKNVRTKNSSQIHLLSRLHQVQMNFTENEVLLQKVDVKHHHPKIIKSPCFCIQIQMSPHRSASFPEFCPTVLSKTSKLATMPVTCRKRSTCPLYARDCKLSFLDLVLGHDEAGLSPDTKVFAAVVGRLQSRP